MQISSLLTIFPLINWQIGLIEWTRVQHVIHSSYHQLVPVAWPWYLLDLTVISIILYEVGADGQGRNYLDIYFALWGIWCFYGYFYFIITPNTWYRSAAAKYKERHACVTCWEDDILSHFSSFAKKTLNMIWGLTLLVFLEFIRFWPHSRTNNFSSLVSLSNTI